MEEQDKRLAEPSNYGQMSAQSCARETTVVAPALNEREGVRQLSGFLHKLYPGIRVIIADDVSTDGTQETVTQCQAAGHNIHLLDRSHASVKGLCASVLDGIAQSQTPYVIVMDADLQHPPEAVLQIFVELESGADVVIGTRYNLVGKWQFSRWLISRLATWLARIRLWLSGWDVSDPMSGLFGIKRELAMELIQTHPRRFERRGYKVLFDFLKFMPPGKNIAETQYHFGQRGRGSSKMTWRIAWLFFVSLFR